MSRASHILSLAIFFIAGAVNLQLPLYDAMAGGMGAGALALVLAGYVGAILPTLVLLGGVSDRLGRKPVVLAALASALLATIATWMSPSIVGLGIARWMQGIGVGLGFGAAAAWITERDGPLVAAGRTSLMSASGFGIGAICTTAWVLLAGETLRPPTYVLWVAILGTLFVLVWRLDAPRPQNPNAKLFRLPAYPPGSLLPAASVVVSWGVAGIVVAVMPGVMAEFAGGWAGVVLFAMLVGGLSVQRHTNRIGARRAARMGNIVLPIGTALLAAGVVAQSLVLVVLGALVTGMCTHGYGYAGGLAQVTGLGDSPARTVSGYFVAAYIGFGLPAVGMGVAVDSFGAAAAFVGLAVIVAGCVGGLLLAERKA